MASGSQLDRTSGSRKRSLHAVCIDDGACLRRERSTRSGSFQARIFDLTTQIATAVGPDHALEPAISQGWPRPSCFTPVEARTAPRASLRPGLYGLDI
jgi:hypothetical protein